MKQYQELIYQVFKRGVWKENRTGVKTLSMFGGQQIFDLRQGFPLVTTKKTSFKNIATELAWFIRGDTNEAWLAARKCGIWKEWANADCDLFDIYGKQMRRFEVANPSIGLVKRREPADDGQPEGIVLRRPLIDPAVVASRGAKTGTVISTKKGGDLVVLDRAGDGKYIGQFQNTGFVVEVDRVSGRSFQDPYASSYCGVGYMGEPHRPYQEFELNAWRGMIKRCYLPTTTTYAQYGAKGVTVCKRWHSFANFLEDISTLPGYESWKREPTNYALDKDYYGANQYGPKTSVFLSRKENGELMGCAVRYKGKLYLSMRACADAAGVAHGEIERLGAERTQAPEGFGYRRIRYVDQLQNAIDQLKVNPDSRRIIISLWNPADEDRAALPACHAMVQFWTRELDLGERLAAAYESGEITGAVVSHITDIPKMHSYLDALGVPQRGISCQLYQRSCDLFLGVPYNIASYALLTHMIGRLVNMEPLEFVWTGGDIHLYENHIDQAKEVLSRVPRGMPKLTVKSAPTIDDFTLDHFELKGYYPHEAIKAEVAV